MWNVWLMGWDGRGVDCEQCVVYRVSYQEFLQRLTENVWAANKGKNFLNSHLKFILFVWSNLNLDLNLNLNLCGWVGVGWNVAEGARGNLESSGWRDSVQGEIAATWNKVSGILTSWLTDNAGRQQPVYETIASMLLYEYGYSLLILTIDKYITDKNVVFWFPKAAFEYGFQYKFNLAKANQNAFPHCQGQENFANETEKVRFLLVPKLQTCSTCWIREYFLTH